MFVRNLGRCRCFMVRFVYGSGSQFDLAVVAPFALDHFFTEHLLKFFYVSQNNEPTNDEG